MACPAFLVTGNLISSISYSLDFVRRGMLDELFLCFMVFKCLLARKLYQGPKAD